MANVSKEDIERHLGKETLKGVKEAAKEETKNQKGGEKLQAVREMLTTAMQTPGVQVFIKVYRKPHMKSKEQFVGIIDYVNPAAIAEYGVEHIVKDYSGGGDYRCLVSAPQIAFEEEMFFSIMGDPVRPLPEREAAKLNPQASSPMLPQVTPQSNYGPAGAYPSYSPYGMPPGGPYGGFGGMNQGMSNPFQQSPPIQPADRVSEMAMLMIAQANKTQQSQPVSSADDEEIRSLREAMAEQARRSDERIEKLMQMQQQSAAERKHDEDMRRLEDQRREDAQRHREELAEANRRHEQMLAEIRNKDSKGSTIHMIEALGTVLGPVLPELLNSRKAEAAATRETYAAIMEANKGSYEASMKTMETLLNQPKSEDRMAKMSEMVFSNMANTAGLVGTLVTGVLKENAGDNPPYWVQILTDIIDKGGDVLKVAMEGDEEGGEYVPTEMETPSHLSGLPQADDAISDTRERMLLAARGENEVYEEPVAQVSEMETPSSMVETEDEELRVPSISYFDSAMQTIFTLIATGGDLPTIAFRLWKHAASGVQAATEWVNYPEEATPFLLNNLVEQGELTLTDERIQAVTDVLVEFHNHMSEHSWELAGAEAWIEKYGITVKMPRAIHSAPTGSDTSEEPTELRPISVVPEPMDEEDNEPDTEPDVGEGSNTEVLDPVDLQIQKAKAAAAAKAEKRKLEEEVASGTPDNIQAMLEKGKALKEQASKTNGAKLEEAETPLEPPITP